MHGHGSHDWLYEQLGFAGRRTAGTRAFQWCMSVGLLSIWSCTAHNLLSRYWFYVPTKSVHPRLVRVKRRDLVYFEPYFNVLQSTYALRPMESVGLDCSSGQGTPSPAGQERVLLNTCEWSLSVPIRRIAKEGPVQFSMIIKLGFPHHAAGHRTQKQGPCEPTGYCTLPEHVIFLLNHLNLRRSLTAFSTSSLSPAVATEKESLKKNVCSKR